MDLDAIRSHCLALPGVTEDTPWEEHFAYKVGGKMFVITSAMNPVSMSIKVTPEDFSELTEREGVTPAPYLAKHNWVRLDKPTVVSARELKRLMTAAYHLIKAKLPKKLQREIEAS